MGSLAKSASPSGTAFTVTFTPDGGTNTVTRTASVTFVEWWTETRATWPDDRNRKTIGVCEEVNITMDPQVQTVSLAATSPASSLQQCASGQWKYIAPMNQTVDEVIALGIATLLRFDVIAPTGYEAKLKTIEVTANDEQGIAGGYAMLFDLVVLPTNVSFYAIKIREVGLTSLDASGYFAEPRNAEYLSHSEAAGANSWATVYKGNKCSDRAQIAEFSHPWGDGGSMTWPIPNEYSYAPIHSSGTYFCNTDQCFSVNSNGTTRLEKFGWFAEATTNRLFSYGRTTTP